MNSTKGFVLLGVFFLLLTTGAIVCPADSCDFSERVARLQYLGGNVSVQPHGTGDWVQGSVIRPLTNADNIWANTNSRAELNLGSARMRVDFETSLTLTKVTDLSVQVELHQGVLNVHVRHLEDGETYEIDTPNVAFMVTKAGSYRIDVSPDEDSTVVTVRQGEGQVRDHQTVVSVHAVEQIEFRGISLDHQVREAPRQDGFEQDGFDKWCQVREQRLDQAVSARYVLRTGSTDVHEYLAWRENLGYGLMWAPTVIVPGWWPYRNVYWFGVNPSGFDLAPLGFTPFPYGR